MKNEFWALDVETANSDYSSICQIGMVRHADGVQIESWSSLIKPNGQFDPVNIGIHGIREDHVRDAPRFEEVYALLADKLRDQIVVHHGHFDRSAFFRCYDSFGLSPIECDWLDSTKVARRTWSQFSKKGYGLAKLAEHFEIALDHHDALSDASAAAQLTELALTESGKSVRDWLSAARRPISKPYPQRVSRDGPAEATFAGKSIVFTGALSLARSEAADMAQRLGFDVRNGVTKKTTHLCVGDQDLARLNGHDKSSKHRKAEELIAKGQDIQILGETEFQQIALRHDRGADDGPRSDAPQQAAKPVAARQVRKPASNPLLSGEVEQDAPPNTPDKSPSLLGRLRTILGHR